MTSDRPARSGRVSPGGVTRAETLGGFLTELRRTVLGLVEAYRAAASRAPEPWIAEQFELHARDFRIHADDLGRCLVDVTSTVDTPDEIGGEIPVDIRGLALMHLFQAREDALATSYQWFLREGPWRVELHVSAVLQLGLSLVLIHRSWLLLARARFEPSIGFTSPGEPLPSARVHRIG